VGEKAQSSGPSPEVGPNLLLPALIRAIVGSKHAGVVVFFICDNVMKQKEDAKREKKREVALPPQSSGVGNG